MNAQIKHAGQYSDLQSLLDDTDRLIEATKESNMGDIRELRHNLEKFQLDSTLVVDKIVNFQIPETNNDIKTLDHELQNIPGDQMEYVVYDKFKAKCVPEFVLFEKWELEERKIKEKAMVLREKQKLRDALRKKKVEKMEAAMKDLSKDEREAKIVEQQKRNDELRSKQKKRRLKNQKKPVRPRMVQMCADAMDPWERMELREKRRKKRLWKKKLMRDKAIAKKVKLASSNTNDANDNSKNRPGTAKAKEVDEERIEIDIMDDLAKDDEDGKSKIAPPKEYISAVQKIMSKANSLWEDRLDSLFRVSRSSDMSHDDFIDCLMDLRIDLKAEEILACYTYLHLDKHAHLKLDRPSHSFGGISMEQKLRNAKYQNQVNVRKSEKAIIARQYQHAHRYVKVQNYRSKMNRASICKINELEGQLERLSRTGLTVDVFRNAMRKARECFRLSPRSGKSVKEFLRKFDYDGDGTISKDEFKMAMAEIKADLTEQELQSCFAYLDPEQTGEVDYNEFVYVFYNRRSMRHKVSTQDSSVITQHPVSPMGHKKGTMKHRMELGEKLKQHRRILESSMITDGRSETHKNFNKCMGKIEEQLTASKHDMEAVFNSIDTDRSGSITREEFVGALQGMDVKLSEKELDVLFCHLDPSSDNRITLNEFRYMYFNRRRITHVMM